MASAAELSVLITGKDVSASKAFNDAEKSASGFGKTLGGVTKLASGFALGGGLLALPSLLGDMTKAAADDAASVSRLQKAVENSGIAWSDYSIELNEVIKGAQELGFTDDQARNSLSLLTAQTGSAEEATNRFALAMDLARGANIDVETASRLLGKVTEENVNVLARYGISVQKGASETELFGALQEKFGGQAATFANSTAGQMAQAQIAIGELKEGIGTALLPVMQHAAGFLLTEFIPAAQKLVGFLQENRVAMIAFGVAAGILVAALLPIPTAIAAIIIGGTLLINHWDEIRAKAEEVWGGLPEPIRIAADFMRDHVVSRVEGVVRAFEAIQEIVQSTVALISAIIHGDWATAWNELKDIGSAAVDLFVAMIQAQFGQLPEILLGLGKDAIQGLIDGIKSKLPDVGGVVEDIANAIPSGLRKLWDSRSPSRVAMEIGEDFVRGLDMGLQAEMRSVIANMDRGAEELYGSFTSIEDQTKKLFRFFAAEGTEPKFLDNVLDYLSAFERKVDDLEAGIPAKMAKMARLADPVLNSGSKSTTPWNTGGGHSAPGFPGAPTYPGPSKPTGGGSTFGSFGVWKSFQHGTPYVPHDMLAYLHRGEAVVPAGRGGGVHNHYHIAEGATFVGSFDARVREQILALVRDSEMGGGFAYRRGAAGA